MVYLDKDIQAWNIALMKNNQIIGMHAWLNKSLIIRVTIED